MNERELYERHGIKPWMDYPLAERKQAKAMTEAAGFEWNRDKRRLIANIATEDAEGNLLAAVQSAINWLNDYEKEREDTREEREAREAANNARIAAERAEREAKQEAKEREREAAYRELLEAGKPIPARLRPPGGRCLRCWKPLRDPESIRIGIGPECMRQLAEQSNKP